MDSVYTQTQEAFDHSKKIRNDVQEQHNHLRDMQKEMRNSCEIWQHRQENAEGSLQLVTNQLILEKEKLKEARHLVE